MQCVSPSLNVSFISCILLSLAVLFSQSMGGSLDCCTGCRGRAATVILMVFAARIRAAFEEPDLHCALRCSLKKAHTEVRLPMCGKHLT